MKQLRLISSLLCVLFMTLSANANLLVDPGFESNPLSTATNVLNGFAAYQGLWGPEAATISGVDGGVTPIEGVQMLRMTTDGISWTQTFQVTDVTSYAALIDSGSAIVDLSAQFNASPALSAALGNVSVLFFSTASYGSQIGTPVSGNLTLDNSPNTWETNAVSGSVPVNTRWLVTQVAYQDASLLAADGSYYPAYVDDADLTIRAVPEPATMMLLAMGGLAVRRKK